MVTLTPQALAAARAEAARHARFDRARYEVVRTLERLNAWISRAKELGLVALDVAPTSLDPMEAVLCGFSLALNPNEACYVPLAHRRGGDGGKDGLFSGGIAPDQIEEQQALAALKPLMEDASVLKIGHNVKFDLQMLALRGIALGPYDDIMLMSYILDAGRSEHGLEALAKRYFDHARLDSDEITGSGKSRITFDGVDIGKATEYAAEDADIALRSWRVLKARLVSDQVASVYETLERPLAAVLARMERHGISINRQALLQLVWGYQDASAGHVVDVHLGRLRHKLQRAKVTAPRITTVRGAP